MQQSNVYAGKLLKIPTLIVLLSVLTACADSIQSSNKPPVLEPAPQELTGACPQPVVLPERELTQAEVEGYWLRDRAALIECGVTKAALLRYYRDRDAGITGSAPS